MSRRIRGSGTALANAALFAATQRPSPAPLLIHAYMAGSRTLAAASSIASVVTSGPVRQGVRDEKRHISDAFAVPRDVRRRAATWIDGGEQDPGRSALQDAGVSVGAIDPDAGGPVPGAGQAEPPWVIGMPDEQLGVRDRVKGHRGSPSRAGAETRPT